MIAVITVMSMFTFIFVWFATSKSKRASNSADERFWELRIQAITNDQDELDTTEQMHTDTTAVVRVSELNNLATVESWIDSIVIEGNQDKGYDDDLQISAPTNPRIRNLKVEGRISLTNLRTLLKATPRLSHLAVNLMLNCQDGKNVEQRPSLYTNPDLEFLTLANASSGCPLLLLFLNSKHQRLKELRIQNSVFNAASCRALEAFLHDASESLHEVVIEGSSMGDCDFRDIHFPNLRNMIVLEPDDRTD